MNDFFEILKKGRKGLTKEDQKDFKKIFTSNINENMRSLRLFFVILLDEILAHNTELRKVKEDGFLNYSYDSYEDSDGKNRIFVSLTYVQDYEDFNDTSEDSVYVTIFDFLKSFNVDKIVNDISVNTLHYRNGKKVSD